MTGANNYRDALLAGFKAGNFLETVYACSLADRDERDDLALELAALHNDGLLDVVAAFEDLKSKSGSDFFLTRHVFETALSHLDAPVLSVMPDSAFAALEESAARETDDQILASVVKSAFALFEQDKAQESRAVALIASALPKGGEHTVYAASTLFGFRTNSLPPALLDLLLSHLKRVNPEHKGTLDNIDYGLSDLLKKGEQKRRSGFWRSYCLRIPAS